MRRKFPASAADFTAWSDRMERRLRQGLWMLLALLLLSQGALRIPGLRTWLTPTERWEGVPYETEGRLP